MKHSTASLASIFIIATTPLGVAESAFERDLKQLEEQRDKALASVTDPINRRYRDSLAALLRRATQSNDLNAAMKIKKELEAQNVSETEAPQKEPNHLFGDWLFQGIESDVYSIYPNQTAKHKANRGTWEVRDGLFTILWDNNWRSTVAISQRGNSIETTNIAPNSTKHPPLLQKWTRKR